MNIELAKKLKGMFNDFHNCRWEDRDNIRISILAYTEAYCDAVIQENKLKK